MHRLVRIEGLHDFKIGNSLKFVLYDGSKYVTLDGKIREQKYIEFVKHTYSADTLFAGFGIKDRWEYCKKYDTKCHDGFFPEHSSLDALKKTLLSFFNLNTNITIPPMYKVGDKVRIKSEYDSGSNINDYPCGFTDVMLSMGSDEKTYTISSIKNFTNLDPLYSLKHYKEPYFYELKEDSHCWSAAMFKGEIKELKDSVKIASIKSSTVFFTDKVHITLDITENYYVGILRVLRKLHQPLVDNKYGSIFHSRITCSKRDTCYEPEVTDPSLLWVILDYLKYYFGTEECKKTINPEFYKYLKEKPKQGIIEQIEYSQTKTQPHAYQFCKVRGTVCRGNVPEGRTVQGKRSKASVSSRSLAYRAVIGQ